MAARDPLGPWKIGPIDARNGMTAPVSAKQRRALKEGQE